MISETMSHYKIIEKLGEGGMGVVYKAHDTKLDRPVALKFLPSQHAMDEIEMARFIQEAKAAAALNHPNVCTIYEIYDEIENPFIVMEYIKGKTLREFFKSTLPLSVTAGPFQKGKKRLSLINIINISLQIAEAIEEAHSKGIVHRDIKPDNIMVDAKNRIKVMDFGLVKLKGSMNITKEGSTVGTTAYMSPEQIQGENVDHRSDIFSFGILLYEMCAGVTPFLGEHEAATIYSIVNEEPQPISFYVPNISGQLEKIIETSLKKDPSDRYQSMENLLNDLTQLKEIATKNESTPTSVTSLLEQKRRVYTQMKSVARSPLVYIAAFLVISIIAVASYLIFYLPGKSDAEFLDSNRMLVMAFENRTDDASLNPIGRLISDWIIQGILKNELAEVIPTTTMLQLIQEVELVGGGLENRAKLIELAKATHSGILVSGMIYQIGQDIQLHAQIIDVDNNEVILTLEPVRGSRNEPMKAIDDLQQKILGALAMHVYPDRDIRMISDPPIFEAYLEYMEGTRYFGVDYEKSFEHYKRAIEIDSEFMYPKLRMAVGYGNIAQFAAADSILQSIDPERHRLSPYERYYLDWYTYFLQGRLEESFAVLLHIESIDPMDITTNYIVGLFALYLNRPQKTVETFEKIDIPIQWADFAVLSWRYGVLSSAYHLLGDYEKELEIARKAQEHYPTDLYRRANEVSALAALGMLEKLHEVIKLSKSIKQTSGNVGNIMLTASRELRAHGNKREALKIAEQAIQWYEIQDSDDSSGLAEALYLAEQWNESLKIRKDLVRQNPNNITYKGALGTLAARLGNEDEARRVANELTDINRKYLFGLNSYLRARIHALLGDRAEAVKLIQESVDQGRHFDVYMHHDIDLESLHDYPPFQELLKPKG